MIRGEPRCGLSPLLSIAWTGAPFACTGATYSMAANTAAGDYVLKAAASNVPPDVAGGIYNRPRGTRYKPFDVKGIKIENGFVKMGPGRSGGAQGRFLAGARSVRGAASRDVDNTLIAAPDVISVSVNDWAKADLTLNLSITLCHVDTEVTCNPTGIISFSKEENGDTNNDHIPVPGPIWVKGIAPGTTTVTIVAKINGSDATVTGTLTVNVTPNVTITVNPSPIDYGTGAHEFQAIGDPSGGTYDWSASSGSTDIAGEDGCGEYTPSLVGAFDIRVDYTVNGQTGTDIAGATVNPP